ncbi:MAG: hypothetical protein KC729_21260, partial [Candidatus Eisenbacteria bacterium]|nr:hypothetical protein [Candidatus Eisenbacteria bacterium]
MNLEQKEKTVCNHHSTRNPRLQAPLLGSSLVAIAALGLMAQASLAGLPPEPIITVQPWDDLNGLFIAPASPAPVSGTTGHIVVHDPADQPIANAIVSVELGASNPLCPGAVVTGVTDANGEVDITVSGGGCAHNQPVSGLIRVNGVTVRAYSNVKSPDFDGSKSNGTVGLADLIAFSAEFLQHSPPECHDYDNNAATDLADVILFAPAFVGSSH